MACFMFMIVVAFGSFAAQAAAASMLWPSLKCYNSDMSTSMEVLALDGILRYGEANLTAEEFNSKIAISESAVSQEELYGFKEQPDDGPIGINTLHCSDCGGIFFMRHKGVAMSSFRCKGIEEEGLKWKDCRCIMDEIISEGYPAFRTHEEYAEKWRQLPKLKEIPAEEVQEGSKRELEHEEAERQKRIRERVERRRKREEKRE